MNEEAIAGYLSEGYDYLVAEEQGKLVGVVATREDRHLFHLFVADAYQGRGSGAATLGDGSGSLLGTVSNRPFHG